MAAETATTERNTRKNELLNDISVLELEVQKALLEKVKAYADKGSTYVEPFARAFVMLRTGKLPGVEFTTTK
jgi:hypothetical protein